MARAKTVDARELPRVAPKKTGRRMPVPEAMAEANEILDAEEVVEVEEEEIAGEDEQGVLLEAPESEMPTVVMGERFVIHYVKPHFKKTKKGERTIALEFSVPLTDDHEELMPKSIREGWKFLLRRGMKRLDIVDVQQQIIKLWLQHDEKEALILPVAGITNVSLAVIQQKGVGESEKVIRLQFRALVKITAQVGKFAEYQFGEVMWIEWHPTQEALFEEEEDGDSE